MLSFFFIFTSHHSGASLEMGAMGAIAPIGFEKDPICTF